MEEKGFETLNTDIVERSGEIDLMRSSVHFSNSTHASGTSSSASMRPLTPRCHGRLNTH